MFILRVSLDPEFEGRLQDYDEQLDVRLGRPLVTLEGVEGIGEIDVAPDHRSAFIPIVVAAHVDVTDPQEIGRIVVNAVEGDLADTPLNVELFMAAVTPGACPICHGVGKHDMSKHVASANYAVGLTQIEAR